MRPEPKIDDVVLFPDHATTIWRLCEDSGTWLRDGQQICASQLDHVEEGVWRFVQPRDERAEEADLLGLTDDQATLLNAARITCQILNESLERSGSTHRWNVLGDSDPRRNKQ